jgi:hypothetical protein
MKIRYVVFFLVFGYSCYSYGQPPGFYARFQEDSQTPYGMLIMDSTGNPVYPLLGIDPECPLVYRCGYFRYVFGDEFNTDATIPDSGKWNYGLPWEEASCGNGELSLNISTRTSTPNLSVSNGTLKMQARYQPTQGKYVHWRPDGDTICVKDGTPRVNAREFPYTSAYLVSRQTFRYGMFHIRCRMPSAWGTWPAFWLFGDGQQEIDWFEFIPSDHQDLRTFGFSVHAETEFNTYTQDFTFPDSLFPGPADNLSTGFYDFVGLWDSTHVSLFIGRNGKYYLNGLYIPPAWLAGNGPASLVNPPCTAPCDKQDNPLLLIISMGVANTKNCVRLNLCPDSTQFPQTLEVDFVRVYQRRNCSVNQHYCTNPQVNPTDYTYLSGRNVQLSSSTDPYASCSFVVESSATNQLYNPSFSTVLAEGTESVRMLPGFHAKAGSNFRARVVDCHSSPSYSADRTAAPNPVFQGKTLSEPPVQLSPFISLYPNPTMGVFTLQVGGGDGAAGARAVVWNALGQRVVPGVAVPESGRLELDLRTEAAGVYLVQVVGSTGAVLGSTRVAVQR